MDIKIIKELTKLMRENDLIEVEVEEAELKIRLKKSGSGVVHQAPLVAHHAPATLALAAALALSTSACGKKDQAPPAAPAPAAAAAPASTTSTSTVGRVAGTTPNELDKKSGTSASNRVGKTMTDRLRGEYTPVEGEPDPKAIAPVVSVEEIEPRSMEVESVVYYDPTGLTRDQIFNKKAQVDLAGDKGQGAWPLVRR